MSDVNYSLFIAAYDDEASAKADFADLKAADDEKVVASVVMSRDSEGKISVKEHGGRLIAAGTGIGAAGGLVVGLFAPPLLLAGLVGAAVGAGVGAIMKHHEEKKIGVDVEEWLPPGTSAIVAVVDDLYLDRIDNAVSRANKKIDRAIDKDDYDAVVKAIDEGNEKIIDAMQS